MNQDMTSVTAGQHYGYGNKQTIVEEEQKKILINGHDNKKKKKSIEGLKR